MNEELYLVNKNGEIIVANGIEWTEEIEMRRGMWF